MIYIFTTSDHKFNLFYDHVSQTYYCFFEKGGYVKCEKPYKEWINRSFDISPKTIPDIKELYLLPRLSRKSVFEYVQMLDNIILNKTIDRL
jgi:hypothetical protein